MSLDHQDWQPVVLRKKLEDKRPAEQRAAEGKTVIQYASNHKEFQKLDSEDPDAPKVIPLSTAKQIQQARCAKGMTQQQLAQQLAVNQNVIRDYEAGKAIPERNLLNKINRILGVRIVM